MFVIGLLLFPLGGADLTEEKERLCIYINI